MKSLIFLFLLLAVLGCDTESGPAETSADSANIPHGSITEQLAFVNDDGNFSSANQQLDTLFKLYMDWYYQTYPTRATYRGIHKYNHRWGDNSLEGRQRALEQQGEFLEAAKTINRKSIPEENRINYDLFIRSLEASYTLDSRFPEQFVSISYSNQFGFHLSLNNSLKRLPLKTDLDAGNLLSRLRGIPEQLENNRNKLQQGLDQNLTMPYIAMVQVPDQLRGLISEDAANSVYYDPVRNLPEDNAISNPEALKDSLKQVILNRINPALDNYREFVENVYLPATRKTYGLSELSDGQAWYAERIRYYTTTSMSAQEIHELGMQEVQRIRTEMEATKEEAGFQGSLEEFEAFLRTDPQFYYTDPEDLLSGYRDICKRVDPGLTKLFGKLPRNPYGVKEIPAYAAPSATTAYYSRGSARNNKPGYFYANTYKLNSRPKWEMEALSLHEAVPGHHLQIALAQELKNVPEFRSTLNFTAFVEGWGLYSESLGPQLGMYTNAYSRYGQLSYQMWRAVRLVVDTGIHSMGWSRQEAIDFFRAHSGKSLQDITVEIDRYIAWPGQALAYKIGELKIRELKQRAKETLGEQFSIRAFHDELLGDGAIPLDILEEKMNRWMQEVINSKG
jgi:uncharacterized protein (DUF885 family)